MHHWSLWLTTTMSFLSLITCCLAWINSFLLYLLKIHLYLVLYLLLICTMNVNITEDVDMYFGDLPSLELMDMELERWKAHYVTLPEGKEQLVYQRLLKIVTRLPYQHSSSSSTGLHIACVEL